MTNDLAALGYEKNWQFMHTRMQSGSRCSFESCFCVATLFELSYCGKERWTKMFLPQLYDVPAYERFVSQMKLCF